MKRTLLIAVVASLLSVMPARAKADDDEDVPSKRGPAVLVAFTAMYGVDGPFVGHNPIRGVHGDELPWEIKSAVGSLTSDGRLRIRVRGLVFKDDPSVPPELRGINDEKEFRAVVSCLSESDDGTQVTTVNITTGGFPSSREGDSNIDAKVKLPKACVAPIVFVMSGKEDLWFSVTGAER